MPSPQASRRNLAIVKRPRLYDESLIVKDLILQWVLLPTMKSLFKTQAELARRLGVSQQYVSKVAKWTLWHCLHNEMGRTYWQRTTLEELGRARERRLNFCSASESPGQEPDSLHLEPTGPSPDSLEESEFSEETFAPEPRRAYTPPAEMHTFAEWEEIQKYGRREYCRHRRVIRFRIPGFY